MNNPALSLLDLWLRRFWVRDADAIGRLPQGRPATLITGASEGIGLAIAERIARGGGPVVLIARRPGPLALAAAHLERRHGAAVTTLAVDITAQDAVARIDDHLARHGLYADTLVNNAGVGLGGPFDSHSAAQIANLIDTNISALTLLTRRFLPDMCVRGRGGIINIASLGGYAPGPNQATYYASKAFVIALTRAVAYESRGLGVRVSVVCPGPVETEFHSRMGSDTALYRYLLRGLPPATVARAACWSYRWGWRVVHPGVLTPVLALAMRLSPGAVSIPIIGLLLRRRRIGNPGGLDV